MAVASAPRWYVVTGAQSSGKTTLVESLRPHVDSVFPEAARKLIDDNLSRGISVEETRSDNERFQEEVLRVMLEAERSADRSALSVFDRGVPDSIAYRMLTGVDPSPVYEFAAGRYAGVFFMELLPYRKDYARRRDSGFRKRLNRLLPEVYGSLGYEVVRVPAMPVEDRLSIVLAHIGNG